jgi:hypothetical protein
MRDPHETCLEIESHLPLWAGGDLEPDVHSSVEDHLSRCDSCARAAVRARSARTALERGLRDEAERMGVGRDPWPAIRASLRAERLLEREEAVPVVRPRPRRLGWAWPVAAAILVGLFLAGTWLPSGGDPGTTTPPLVGVVDPPKSANPTSGSPLAVIPAGMRRPAPGEPRMRDTAWLFRPGAPDAVELEGGSSIAAPGHSPQGAAVSLERVKLLPQR